MNVKKFFLRTILFLVLFVGAGIASAFINQQSVHADFVTSTENPQLSKYQKLFYSDGTYVSNPSTYYTVSTRAVRVSKWVGNATIGLILSKVPTRFAGTAAVSRWLGRGMIAFDFFSAWQVQGKSIGDVWPKVESRLISVHNKKTKSWLLVGEEVRVTLYSNSSHTNAVGHKEFYHWVR